MKNPNSVAGAGAFRMTETATVGSSVDAMRGRSRATPDRRYRWCNLSNSVQPIAIRKGRIDYV